MPNTSPPVIAAPIDARELACRAGAGPVDHWPANNCVAWNSKAARRCGRARSAGYLCARHHRAALATYGSSLASQARAVAVLRLVGGAEPC